MHTLRESAIIQRDILNAYQRGDLITIKIQIDRLKIVSPEVGEHANGPVQHVSIGGGKRGSKNKGSKVQVSAKNVHSFLYVHILFYWLWICATNENHRNRFYLSLETP